MKIVPASRPMVKGRKDFERAVPIMEALASDLSPKNALVEVNLVGERRMAELNREHRGRKGASEILTFCYGRDPGLDREAESPFGEIFLCWQRLSKGALVRKVPCVAYLLRLFVHGLCHLKGYRHDDAGSERRMESVEKKLLRPHLPEEVVTRLFA
jgi:rRNA maturation RNase YbeY